MRVDIHHSKKTSEHKATRHLTKASGCNNSKNIFSWLFNHHPPPSCAEPKKCASTHSTQKRPVNTMRDGTYPRRTTAITLRIFSRDYSITALHHHALHRNLRVRMHHSKKTCERHATRHLTETNDHNNPKNIFSRLFNHCPPSSCADPKSAGRHAPFKNRLSKIHTGLPCLKKAPLIPIHKIRSIK
jgi:hypothetical protein